MEGQSKVFVGRSVLIVQHPITLKYLAIRETKNRGWWIPGGKVDPCEDFDQAAVRECREEAGIDVELKGIIKIQQNFSKQKKQRMKVIYYAHPLDPSQAPKQAADKESEEARWVTIGEYKQLVAQVPRQKRGMELLYYSSYLENGGRVYPLTVLERADRFTPPQKLVMGCLSAQLERENEDLQRQIDELRAQGKSP